MRLIISFFTAMIASGATFAHVLDDHHDLSEQIAHQIFGAHHIALILVLLIVGFVLVRAWLRTKNTAQSRNQSAR